MTPHHHRFAGNFILIINACNCLSFTKFHRLTLVKVNSTRFCTKLPKQLPSKFDFLSMRLYSPWRKESRAEFGDPRSALASVFHLSFVRALFFFSLRSTSPFRPAAPSFPLCSSTASSLERRFKLFSLHSGMKLNEDDASDPKTEIAFLIL